MSNNKYSENLNQSGINQQQQQDLMQAAALMFPSLFMAQQFTSSPLNTQSAQQNQHVLLQTLQRQQQTSSSCQLNQQQQQTEQTNKILASLIQQQSINQMATNDWLQLLNNQANCGRQTSISQHLRVSLKLIKECLTLILLKLRLKTLKKTGFKSTHYQNMQIKARAGLLLIHA